jgi:choline dehydrogenase-like flavoprotein
MTDGKDCVLGSGPAAVACAHELVKAGRKVIMIDPARGLAPDRRAFADEFRRNPDPQSFVRRMREWRSQLPPALRTKRLPFSSPHIFQDVDRFLPTKTRGVYVTPTLAGGGLSTTWGATVMPMSARSFRNWPVTLEDMAPFYRSVANIIDIPVVRDDLEKIYPNFGSAPPVALSAQGAQLLANLLNNRSRLAKDGIIFGRCRSAVGGMYANNDQGCVYCGLCMYGCPYRAIFSAEYVTERLKTQKDFSHKAGGMAEHYEEKESRVFVRVRNLDNGNEETLECERLFIACGAVTSLRLVAGAMKWFDYTFHLADTQLVTIPAFLLRRCGIGAIPQANALGQIFIEIDDPEICDELIHLQIYGFNPFIADLLRERWGKFFIGEKLLQPLFDRMMMIMAYLPGQISGKVAMRVNASSQNGYGLPLAVYTGESNTRTLPAVRRLKHRLKAHWQDFGLVPATPLAEICEPGISHHLAGGLPMRQTPGPKETDRLGRPFGSRRVHVVDGACFSSLPAEHLTYTIMANAARIAAQSAGERLP